MRACEAAAVVDAPKVDCATGLRLPKTDRPLAGLAGSTLADRFRHWFGLSGTRYLFSIFSLTSDTMPEDVPRHAETVLLAVRRHDDGTRTILMAADTGPLPDLLFDGQALRDAVASGANEVHMHLLAEDAATRQAIVEDFGG